MLNAPGRAPTGPRSSPHADGIGSYVNFMTDYEDDRIRSAYGPKFDRLQQLKAKYDPQNVFHMNANIPPPS